MDDNLQTASGSEQRCKLGLALAGGGFRASLFHLGVLRRMAELDILRYVEVLSTVSGGSIIGALYALLLKKHLDAKELLEREDYIKILDELDIILVAGVKKNLRTRLFMNPLGLLRVLLSGDSLGKRMARLYERYIYSDVVNDLQTSAKTSFYRPGKFRLKDLLINPGKRYVQEGLEEYNRLAVKNKGSVVTKLILNATSLNSGTPFWFSAVEIGDPRLGFIRQNEIEELQQRKLLLEMDMSDLQEFVGQQASSLQPVFYQGVQIGLQTGSLALWWKERREAINVGSIPGQWQTMLNAFPAFGDIANVLAESEFGYLRTMKLAAWYIRRGMKRTPPVAGGLSESGHMERFWDAFSSINKSVAASSCRAAASNTDFRDRLLDFVLELYYMRTAEIMSKDIRKDWEDITLGEAVGASACFPPVFPPFLMLGFYDDMHVTRLGLTDGGVYDNIGLSAVLDERCTHIIASDTSGLFDIEQRSAAGRITMSGRIASILMDDVAALQRNGLRLRRRFSNAISKLQNPPQALQDLRDTSGLEGLAFFHIASPHIEGPGIAPKIDGKLIASLRTDLDGFGDIEIAALVNRGYDIADRYIRTHFAGTPYMNPLYWQPATCIPKPLDNIPADKVEKVLKAGKGRFFRSLKLFAPVSIVFTIFAAVVALVITWNMRLSIRDVMQQLQNSALSWLESTVPLPINDWTNIKFAVGPALLIGAIMVILILGITSLISDRTRYRYLHLFRSLFTFGKWFRTMTPKLIWLVGGGTFIIAFIVSIVALIGHVFYYLPFARMTRIRPDS